MLWKMPKKAKNKSKYFIFLKLVNSTNLCNKWLASLIEKSYYSKKFWCATSLKYDGSFKEWGWCSKSCKTDATAVIPKVEGK